MIRSALQAVKSFPKSAITIFDAQGRIALFQTTKTNTSELLRIMICTRLTFTNSCEKTGRNKNVMQTSWDQCHQITAGQPT